MFDLPFKRSRSLRLITGAVSAALFGLALLLTWGIFFYHTSEVSQSLVQTLSAQVRVNVELYIDNFFKIPRTITRIDADVLSGPTGLDNRNRINRFFWRNLKLFPGINALFYGDTGGRMYGARNNPEGPGHQVMFSSPAQANVLTYYQTDDDGNALTETHRAVGYDPRVRSWYTRAVKSGTFTWSPVYVDYASKALVITAARPVTDGGGLKGVVGCGLKLTEVGGFLSHLADEVGGTVYISDSEGKLVASSKSLPLYSQQGEEFSRITVAGSEDELIRSSYQQLAKARQSLKPVTLSGHDEDYFMVVIDFPPSTGLNWTGVVLLPESRFLNPLHRFNLFSLLMVLLVFISIAVFSAWLLNRMVARPIKALTVSAEAMGEGQWSTPVDTGRADEIGQLSRAFGAMAERLAGLVGNQQKMLVEKDTLLKELYHRTKNNMQVIQAMLALRAGKSQEPAMLSLLQDVELKIEAMALVHRMLYSSRSLSEIDLAAYFDELCHNLLAAMNAGAAEIKLDITARKVPVDFAVPIGLVVNELTSNSIKHAFAGMFEKALIGLTITFQDGQCRLEFYDNGSGLPEGFDVFKSDSLGLQTVIMICRSQMGGEITFNDSPNGGLRVVCTMAAPVHPKKYD